MSSKSAIFKNKIDISGNLDISGDLTVSDKLEISDSSSSILNIYGLDILPIPTDLCGQVLSVNSTGDGLEWIKSDSVGGTTGDTSASDFYKRATTDVTTSTNNGGSGTSGFYTSLLGTLGISTT